MSIENSFEQRSNDVSRIVISGPSRQESMSHFRGVIQYDGNTPWPQTASHVLSWPGVARVLGPAHWWEAPTTQPSGLRHASMAVVQPIAGQRQRTAVRAAQLFPDRLFAALLDQE